MNIRIQEHKDTRARGYVSLARALALVCACALLAAPSPALAAPGDLVPAFGAGGTDGDGVITSTTSWSITPSSIAIDSGSMYLIGNDGTSTNNLIEKRRLDNGNLDASFDGDGVVVSSAPASSFYDIIINSASMYIVGSQDAPSTTTVPVKWRIEKRSLTTGSLSWAQTSNPYPTFSCAGCWYAAKAIAIDSTSMYVVGEGAEVGRGSHWRIEKRRLNDGALDTSFDVDGVVISDPTTGDDVPYAIAIDLTYMYVGGRSNVVNGRWRLEKRRLDNGALDTSFDGDGIVETDYGGACGGNCTEPRAIAIDSTYMYTVGKGYGSYCDWRIEKRRLDNGNLDTSFDGDGVAVTSRCFSGSYEGVKDISIDSNYMYIVGGEMLTSPFGDIQWRIEKRNLSNGSLDASFGSGGVVTNNPNSNADYVSDGIYAIAIDSTAMYVAGNAPSGQSSGWRIEKRESGGSGPPPPPPTVNLSAFPATITSGQSSTLSWDSPDANSCAAVDPPGWTSSTATSGAEVVWPVTTTTYTIQCTNAGGTTQQSTTVTVTAPVCANGDLIWGKIEDPTGGNDAANDIAVDNNGIYIVGDEGGQDKWRMEKRDFNGNALWTQTFDNIPGGGSETAQDVAVDISGVYIVGGNFLAGNSYQWRMEKRNLNDGTLMWAQTSNPNGTDNSSTTCDRAYGVTVDSTGLYAVGEDVPSGDTRWRIEKRDLINGALCTATNPNCSAEFGTGGVIISDPDTSPPGYQGDVATSVAVNSAGLYVVGWETTNWVIGPSTDTRWRIEKRDPTTGNLIWARTSKYGVVDTPDKTTNVAIDSTGIYVVGYHYPPAGGNEDWRMEKWDFDGNQVWQQTYSSAGNGQDWAQSVTVDGTGVYVGGSLALGTYSAHMRKLSLTDGSLLWSTTTGVSFPQEPGEMTTANGLAVDCRGVYWAGYYSSGFNYSWTVALREAGGSCGCGTGGGGTPPPTVSLTATPSTINSGDSSTLTWTSTDASACMAFSPAGWTSKTTTNDSEVVTNITSTTTYIIECAGAGGTSQQSATVTVQGGGGNDCGLRVYDGTATVTLDCENPATTTSLRIYKGGVTYGIKLVDPADPNASRLRIQTPSGIKALRKQ